MFHPLLERVRGEASGERALETVRALTRFHRVQASPGYDQASSWLAEALESYGLQVEVDRVPGDGHTRLLGQLMPEGWDCSRAVATLWDGQRRERLCDYEAVKLSLILRSGPARGRFALIDVGEGTESAHYQGREVAGRVVLTRGDVHRVHELAILERGAAGMLSYGRRLLPPVRDAMTDPDALAYTSFWWEAGEPRGWGFVISPRVASRLRERLGAGTRLELEVEIGSRFFPTAIPLLSARLPGTAADEVLVVSHLCHPQPSANDNASGAAANLESARTLAALHRSGTLREPRLSIRFLWIPELTGTHAFLASKARASRLVAGLNLDMVGEDQARCGSTLLVEHPPCFAASFAEELLLRIREAVRTGGAPGSLGLPLARMGEAPFGGGSDHAVLIDPAVGVPCPMLIQWPDRYYHSSLDTPDKCDPDALAIAACCAATYAGFLVTLDDRGRAWLVSAVGRGARRRLLGALDEPEPARAVARERLRGRLALVSLGRLGVPAGVLSEGQRSFEEFAGREAGETPPDGSVAADPRAPRPRRVLAGPLPYPRRLLPGWSALDREARERWRRLDRETPQAGLIADLAWSACDGHRTLDQLARLVELETGRSVDGFLEAFFELTARLGLSSWSGEESACNPNERLTAGR